MTEFNVGDRVRILDLATTATYVGRVGEVSWVDDTLGGGARVSYVVSLDPDAATPAVLTHAVFSPDELESEQERDRP